MALINYLVTTFTICFIIIIIIIQSCYSLTGIYFCYPEIKQVYGKTTLCKEKRERQSYFSNT